MSHLLMTCACRCDPSTLKTSYDKADKAVPGPHGEFCRREYRRGLFQFFVILAVVIIAYPTLLAQYKMIRDLKHAFRSIRRPEVGRSSLNRAF